MHLPILLFFSFFFFYQYYFLYLPKLKKRTVFTETLAGTEVTECNWTIGETAAIPADTEAPNSFAKARSLAMHVDVLTVDVAACACVNVS